MYFLYKNEYRVFNPVEITGRRVQGRKEKNGGDEPILDIIHYTWKSRNETPCIDISNKQKCSFSKTEVRRSGR
jgi:hypothetical protein